MTALATRSPRLLWVSTAARLVLAGILGYAGAIKAVDPQTMVRAVQAYQIFPPAVGELVGLVLPFLEIGLAVLLLVGLATRFAAAVTAVLMVAFIAGVASAWARGLSIDCGCFGGGGQIDPSETRYLEEILRDLGFLALACWLVVFPASRLAVDRHGRHEATPQLPHLPSAEHADGRHAHVAPPVPHGPAEEETTR
ncbi:MAG TPA: MauE/DoxX family redox-associated membrane protein [Jiangellales bacterium]|nr:MauE/DoxX family redox-associated membrane protein [Jiangellales bacterium]